MPALPLAVTVRLPLPLKMSWASLKKAAFSSSSSGVAVYEAPSLRLLVPSTTTNVRFLLWLLMAAPLGLVMLTPLSLMPCFLELYSLKKPLEVEPLSSYMITSEPVFRTVTPLPLTVTKPLVSPVTVASPVGEKTMEMVRAKVVFAISSSLLEYASTEVVILPPGVQPLELMPPSTVWPSPPVRKSSRPPQKSSVHPAANRLADRSIIR